MGSTSDRAAPAWRRRERPAGGAPRRSRGHRARRPARASSAIRALRGLFQRDRRLLDLLARRAYDAVHRCFTELFGRNDVRPGVVPSPQTFGSFARNFHPHIQAHITDRVSGRRLSRGLPACYHAAVEETTGAEVDRRMDALLAEAQAYFMGEGGVHDAAVAIGRRLSEAGIPHAIAGALALGEHGFKRLTTDVDILITREGLERFKAEWLGRGYVNVRPGGKAVRDAINNVKIDFLLTGDYPGDGLPKPVSFPDPAAAGVAGARYRVVSLPRLIEMKLASGMTAPHRMHDLADILRLIREAGLRRDFALELDPYVRVKFDELWVLAQHPDDDY